MSAAATHAAPRPASTQVTHGAHGWVRVALATLAIGWGGNQFTPLLHEYRVELGFSQVDVDVFLGAYVLGLVPGLLVASALSDQRGRRPVLLAGLVCSVVGSVLIGLGDVAGYPAIFVGRLVTGVAVGIAMSVGTAWISELSPAGAGARRATVALTGGFALGPGAAGLLAQLTSPALVWPYVVHGLVAVGAMLLMVGTRRLETRGDADGGLRLRHRLRVPAAAHRRFVRVVLPMAPWIFGSAGIAYAIVPQLVAPALGGGLLVFTTAVTVATLLAGVAVQPVARRLDDASTARAIVVSMVLMTTGVALAALTARWPEPWVAVVVALLLGLAYGIAVVSGLLEVQRIAADDELAGLTGVYYALAYVGFLLPAALAGLAHWFSYGAMLGVVALVSGACLVVCASGWSKHLPTR